MHLEQVLMIYSKNIACGGIRVVMSSCELAEVAHKTNAYWIFQSLSVVDEQSL